MYLTRKAFILDEFNIINLKQTKFYGLLDYLEKNILISMEDVIKNTQDRYFIGFS